MLRNAEQEPINYLTADVCICGAGPAGITLARFLASQNVSVVLIEGGDLEYSDESQDLYSGTLTGLPYFDLDATRLRFFGGSSNHWMGHSGELDAEDFLAWGFHRHSGWPIEREALAQYAPATMEILDLEGAVDAESGEVGLPHLSPYFHSWSIWESPPTLFGQKYLGEIKSSRQITCVVNLNLLDIVPVASRSPDRTGVCCAGRGTPSAHEMTAGRVFYQKISPIKGQIVIYRAGLGQTRAGTPFVLQSLAAGASHLGNPGSSTSDLDI